MKKNKLMYLLSAIITLILLAILSYQLMNSPTFILPPIYMAILIILGLIIIGSIVSGIIKLMFKNSSFYFMVNVLVSIGAIISIYKFYSPNLTITVPTNFVGQVTLVLSNVEKNELTVDENGIGYINEWTFDKVYTKPIVIDSHGTDISERTVGFNPSTFWAKGSFSEAQENVESKSIKYLSFEVVPKDKIGQKQYYHTKLAHLVDQSKL